MSASLPLLTASAASSVTPSAGNLCPCCCSSGQSPRPRAIFACKLRPLGIPPEQVLYSKGLTFSPQAIFAVGIGHREIPRERHVVGHGSHGGEDFPPPD
jgi:hypothetical protein